MAQNAVADDILFASIRTQGELLRTRKLSPIDLTEAYLDRLQRHGERLGAVVTLLRDQALAEAKTADDAIRRGNYLGPLHGIPYGAKDLLATRGIPTTWGAEPYRKQVFDFDAEVIRRLRAAGAILVAKLAMIELAGAFGYDRAESCFTGPCRNPWNLDFWAGGSSSGPGAATAAALVSFSIGSETSGSIVTPAAFCGLSGLRPTYGRVSRHGAMALSWTLDKLGPMCRSADDCGLVLAAIAGRDRKDPTSVNKAFRYPEPAGGDEPKKFRIGIVKDAATGIMPAVRENFERSIKELSQFCEVTEAIGYPALPFGPVVGTIIDAEGASAIRDLIESGRIMELASTRLKLSSYAAIMVSAVDYLQAMRARAKMKRTLDALHARFDALIAPARTTVANPIGKGFNDAYRQFSGGPAVIPAGNIAGQPTMCVPNGLGPNNLPTGLQFMGRAWSEGKLLALAAEYQRRTEWHRRRPELAKK